MVFQGDVAVPDGAWSSTFTPGFTFTMNDTVRQHDVFIDVRHTTEYPFQDMYIFVTLEGPGGRTTTDTVDLLLADPSGRWSGDGLGFIHADRYHAHVLYRYRNRFPRAGEYTVTLQQAMRRDPLPGVIDVGVSIERSAGDR